MRAPLPALAALLTALLGVSACGDGGAAPATPSAAGCRGAVVAWADLDGDGTDAAVRLCGHRLVTRFGPVTTDLDVAGLRLRRGGAAVVHRDGAADLVLLRSASVGGRWQPHLFGQSGRRLAEVVADGRPVLPAVTTRLGSAPRTATCTPGGGIAVLSAEAHLPPGIVLAWDVTRTTYAVRAATAVRTGSVMVQEAAADPTLRKVMPHLFDGTLFADCD